MTRQGWDKLRHQVSPRTIKARRRSQRNNLNGGRRPKRGSGRRAE